MPIVPPVLRAGTRDLPDLPPLVQYLIGAFLESILAWLSSLVYRPLLQRCADHPLVLLAHYYDPAAVVAACAAYHHAPDTPGRPPTFSIEQFVRAEIVRAWADSCSDPALFSCSLPICSSAGSSICRWPLAPPTTPPWPTFTPS